MSRYIDYDALDYKNWHMIGKSSDFIDGVVYMAERIEEAPSIDLADYVPKDFHDKTCEAMAKRHTEEIQRLMPKRGEWEEKETFHNGDDNPIIEEWQSARCSVCNKYHTTPYMYYFNDYNFCPNCGCAMTKESE